MWWPLMKNSITFMDKLRLVMFILLSDKYTNGAKVREFEQAWSEWLGVKYSLFVSSGSTANLLLIAAVKELYKIPNGSKVLVPANTWVTNVSPVIQLGLEPVFADISLEHFSFDEKKLVPDPDIRIVFVTHLLGLNAPIEKFKEFYPNAIFLEDICESHGVTDNLGVRRGSTSSLGSTFSFYYGHHMTTVEGGMISTNDKKLYELLRLKRSHGMAREMSSEEFTQAKADWPNIDGRFLFLTDGFNFRNTEFGAVLGLAQLPRLDASINQRKLNYATFIEELSKVRHLFYIPNADSTNSSFSLPFICRDAAMVPRLKKVFDEMGVEHRPVVAGNLLQQPFLQKWSKTARVPNAELVNSNGVYVGNNQFVTPDMVKELFKCIMASATLSSALM
jgi:CDP-6-deoxy-D-xylo-4-hexulose-3-dehydrase